ncbi:hypothetical protein D3C76_451800 [compost metagenome]
MQHSHAIGGQQLLIDLLTQLSFKIGDVHLIGVSVHQAGQIETAGSRLESRADEGANLPCRFVRLVLHGAHEALHIVWITLHLPGHVSLNNDAQAIARTHILQTTGRGAQPQIHRNRCFERRRPAPAKARFQQHSRRIAKTRDDRRFSRPHLNQARSRHGKRHQQSRPAHASPREWAGFLRITVVVMTMVMSAMAVIVAAVVSVIVSM